MLHPALAGLQAALDADPLGTTARLVLADWYEKQGDEEGAACMRWMAREGKAAYWSAGEPVDFGWRWTRETNPWLQGAIEYKERYASAGLPESLYAALPETRQQDLNTHWWSYYPTRQAAEDALLTAWRALPAAERPT